MRKPDYPDADPERWCNVDAYFTDLLAADDVVLATTLSQNAAASMPTHDVSALQGQFLALLISAQRSKRVLEIGTLGGYSTIRMGRALPEDGLIVTIEVNPDYAAVAKENFKRAGLDHKIHLLEGRAADVLEDLNDPFDLIFIDADKPSNPIYLDHAIRLSRPGTIIIGDNVVRGGAVVEGDSPDPNVEGVRKFLEMISDDPRLTATAMQTVGEKGWDGFVMAVVGDP